MKMYFVSVLVIVLATLSLISCGESNCGGNFPKEHEGTCWSDRPEDVYTFTEAKAYCEGLGGRLPTISELRTLVQNCAGTETGGACGVTDSCTTLSCKTDGCLGCSDNPGGNYSVFDDEEVTMGFFSSTGVEDDTTQIWALEFYTGFLGVGCNSTCTGNVRCVEK